MTSAPPARPRSTSVAGGAGGAVLSLAIFAGLFIGFLIAPLIVLGLCLVGWSGYRYYGSHITPAAPVAASPTSGALSAGAGHDFGSGAR